MRIAITILAALTAAVTAMGTALAATQSKAQSPTVPQVLMLNQLNGTAHAYQQPATLNVELDVPPYPPSRVLRDLHWARWDAVLGGWHGSALGRRQFRARPATACNPALLGRH